MQCPLFSSNGRTHNEVPTHTPQLLNLLGAQADSLLLC